MPLKYGHSDYVEMQDSVERSLPGRIVEDTVIGKWALKVSKAANDVIVKGCDYTLMDSSVFVTLAYEANPVVAGLEIRTKDLMGTEGEYLMHWGGNVEWESDSALYLGFGCYHPDSDFGWDLLYRMRPNGVADLFVVETELGVEGYCELSRFMTLYLCEREAGVSVSGMKPLFDRYCAENVVSDLLSGDIVMELPDMDFRYANEKMSIMNLDEDLPDTDGHFLYKVRFGSVKNGGDEQDAVFFDIIDKGNKIVRIWKENDNEL